MRISDWSSDVCSSDLRLDLHMPGNHGLAGLAAIRAQYPGVAVIVVSANDDPRVVRRALDHGAAGYLPKSSGLDELRYAIRSVMACEQWLPRSEEHTSELQSLMRIPYAVLCLKKQKQQ